VNLAGIVNPQDNSRICQASKANKKTALTPALSQGEREKGSGIISGQEKEK
jgi:hypothetical protein